jgi:membrane-associated phospholipid phosphatase
MTAVVALLCPAVVYLRAHYIIDVPAGLLIGIAFAIFTRRA